MPASAATVPTSIFTPIGAPGIQIVAASTPRLANSVVPAVDGSTNRLRTSSCMTRPDTAIAEPARRRAAVRGPRLVSSVPRSKSATPTPRLATVSATSATRPAAATTRAAADPGRLTGAGKLVLAPVIGVRSAPGSAPGRTPPRRTLGVEHASGAA